MPWRRRADWPGVVTGRVPWQWLHTTLAVRRFELERLLEGTQVLSLAPGWEVSDTGLCSRCHRPCTEPGPSPGTPKSYPKFSQSLICYLLHFS